MTSETETAAAEPKKLTPEEITAGYRRAHLAALYANLRDLLAKTLDPINPVLGIYGVAFKHTGAADFIVGGAVPRMSLMSAIGAMQGEHIANRIAAALDDKKGQGLGDQFNPETGLTHCEACKDGAQDGSHAKEELERNARAWLGLLCLVAGKYYAEHLPPEARGPLDELLKIALPAGEKVS